MPRRLVASLALLLLASSHAAAAYLDVNDPASLRRVIADKAVDNQLILFVYTRHTGFENAWRDMATQLAFSLERVGHPNYVVVAFDELRAATPLVAPTCVTNSILHRTHGYSNSGAQDLWVVRVRGESKPTLSRRAASLTTVFHVFFHFTIHRPVPPVSCADARSVRSTTRPPSWPGRGAGRRCWTLIRSSHARSCPSSRSCRKRACSFAFVMHFSNVNRD